jgi:hypothetical protein
VPTVFYGWSPDKEQNQQLRDWGEVASEITTCSEEFWRIVEEVDADYVYIREGIGSLQEEGLAGCEHLNHYYSNSAVHIYKIDQ